MNAYIVEISGYQLRQNVCGIGWRSLKALMIAQLPAVMAPTNAQKFNCKGYSRDRIINANP